MNKRMLLSCFLIVLLAGLVIGCGAAPPRTPTPTAPTPAPPAVKPAPPPAPVKATRLKWAIYVTRASTFTSNYQVPWALWVEKETGGRVVIDLYFSETLVKASDMYDALLNGITDLAVVSPSRHAGRLPLTEMSVLPLLWDSSLIAALSLAEAHETFLKDELKAVKSLGTRPNGPANIVHRSKNIKTVEDFKGQKWSGTGWIAAELAKTLGGVAVALGPGEMYDALARGMIDMTLLEWEGQHTWKTFEAGKYRTDGVGLQLTAADVFYAMRWESYNKLPADIRAVIDKYSIKDISEINGANMDREIKVRFNDILEFDKKMGNPPPYTFPAKERERLKEMVKPLHESYTAMLEAKKVPATEILNKYKQLSAKYAAMYPPGSEAEYALWKKWGYESLYPGHPEGYIMPLR